LTVRTFPFSVRCQTGVLMGHFWALIKLLRQFALKPLCFIKDRRPNRRPQKRVAGHPDNRLREVKERHIKSKAHTLFSHKVRLCDRRIRRSLPFLTVRIYFRLLFGIVRRTNLNMPKDLCHPSLADEKSKHKLKRLIQSPNSFFMDVKCPGCFHITTIFSHAQVLRV
jgi:hypothetical protein